MPTIFNSFGREGGGGGAKTRMQTVYIGGEVGGGEKEEVNCLA